MKNKSFFSGLSLIVSMLIFGSISLIARHTSCPSEVLSLTRAVLGTAILFVIILIKSFLGAKKKQKTSKRTAILVFVSGAAIGINWVCFFEAYDYISVSETTVIYYLAPVFVMILSPLILKERLDLKKILCILVALVGTVLISNLQDLGDENRNSVGMLWAFAAAILYAFVMILNRYMTDIDVLKKTAYQLLSAGLVLLPYTILKNDGLPTETMKADLPLLLVLGFVYTGLAYFLYFFAMTNLKAGTVALCSYIDPVTAILLSVFVLKETMNVWQWIGAALIIGALLAGDLPVGRKEKAE